MPVHSQYSQLQYCCSHPGCNRWFKNQSGLTQHRHAKYPRVSISPPSSPRSRSESPPASPNSLPTRSPTPQNAEEEDFPHIEAQYFGPHNGVYRNYHPFMTGQSNGLLQQFYLTDFLIGRPCDSNGDFLPPDTQPPPPPDPHDEDDWSPFHDHLEFELADFLYTHNQMPV